MAKELKLIEVECPCCQGQLFIDPEVCIDCGACVSACPVEAIYADSDVPDKWKEYIDSNATYFKS